MAGAVSGANPSVGSPASTYRQVQRPAVVNHLGSIISKLPNELGLILRDRSDPKGRALMQPQQFASAARLIRSQGGGLDNEHAKHYSWGVRELGYPKNGLQRFSDALVQLGYDPKAVLSERVGYLAQIDAALARWQKLPTQEGDLRKAVNDLVALEKTKWVRISIVHDANNAIREHRKARYGDIYISGHSPGYEAARRVNDERHLRVERLTDVLSRQIAGGRVDPFALATSFPELAEKIPRLAEFIEPLNDIDESLGSWRERVGVSDTFSFRVEGKVERLKSQYVCSDPPAVTRNTDRAAATNRLHKLSDVLVKQSRTSPLDWEQHRKLREELNSALREERSNKPPVRKFPSPAWICGRP